MATQIRGSQIKSGTIASDRLVGTDITSLANLATVGTVTSGTWQGGVIALTYLDTSIATQTYVGTQISNLGLGTMSTQNANNVSITGGSVSGITDLAVADGGTGASTASDARTNLGLAIGSDVQAHSSTLDAVSAGNYGGASSINTLGTITSGIWNGSTVDVAYGGTGATTASGARTNLGLVIGTDVQAHSSTLDAVAGGTYTGSSSITTLGTIATGVWNGTALGANYVPALDGLNAPTSSVSLNSQKITNLATPTSDNDAANKSYVDAMANGLTWKAPVMTVGNANVSISSPGAAINGYTLNSGDRVLLQAQTDATQNGIYVWNGTSSAMTRSADFNSSTTALPGAAVFVEAGNAANKAFVCNTTGTITVGTTSISFVLFTGTYELAFGNGLSKNNATATVSLAFPTGGNPAGVQADGTGLHLKLDGATLTESSSGVKVSSGGITATEIANGAVGTNQLTANAVTSAKIAASAVGTAQINAAAVDATKLAASVVASGGGLVGGAGTALSVQFAVEALSAPDGSTTAFSLSHAPSGGKLIGLFRNGLFQKSGSDYTLSGSTATFTSAPNSGDDLMAVYLW